MMKHSALIIIDRKEGLLQRGIYQKQGLIDNVNRLLRLFHEKKGMIFLARHTNNSFSKPDTPDWQLYHGLELT